MGGMNRKIKFLSYHLGLNTFHQATVKAIIIQHLANKPFLELWEPLEFVKKMTGDNNLFGLDSEQKQKDWWAENEERVTYTLF